MSLALVASSVEFGGRMIAVRELPLGQLRNLARLFDALFPTGMTTIEASNAAVTEAMADMICLTCDGITREEVLDTPPSRLMPLLREAWKVNSLGTLVKKTAVEALGMDPTAFGLPPAPTTPAPTA
jgi:hypothetical protein